MTIRTDYTNAKERLITKINKDNCIQLNPDYFDISEPEIFTDINQPLVNTKVVVTPLPGSGFNGSVEIHYRRISFDEICSTMVLNINSSNLVYLKDVINLINTKYNLQIIESDYINILLPPYNSLYPARLRYVELVAKPTSYFFTGNFTLILHNNQNAIVVNGIIYKYFIYLDQVTEVKARFICLNSDGSTNSDFSFLGNLVNLTTFNVSSIINLKNERFVFIGEFNLSYNNELNNLIDVNGSKIVIDSKGYISEVLAENKFTLYNHTRFIPNRSVTPDTTYYYTIDEGNTSKPHCLYRFLYNGELDVNYSPQIDCIPVHIAIDNKDRLYTVSKTITALDPFLTNTTTQQIRIDRLLTNGNKDPNFNTIYLRNSDIALAPIIVSNINPTDYDGLYVALQPTLGVDIATPHPVINGFDIGDFPINLNSSRCWNPVLRFHDSGEWDSFFTPILKAHKYTTVALPNPTVITGKTLAVTTDEDFTDIVTLFSYYVNSFTGLSHTQPLTFSRLGNIKPYLPVHGLAQFKWVEYKSLLQQKNGDIIAYGTLQTIDTSGDYGSPYKAVVRYCPDGVIDKILWRSDLTTSIKSIFLKEYTE